MGRKGESALNEMWLSLFQATQISPGWGLKFGVPSKLKH